MGNLLGEYVVYEKDEMEKSLLKEAREQKSSDSIEKWIDIQGKVLRRLKHNGFNDIAKEILGPGLFWGC